VKFSASPLPLLCVLLLALALRVWGITWGLPSATHYFSYHPDESVMLETSSVTMNVFAGHLLPHYYNYPSLQLYLVCFANTLGALFGEVEIVPKAFAVWYPEWAKMYLVGRSLTVGMSVGTVWVTYAVGARLWGRRAGLAAALLLAVMPLHAQQSHFLTVDVPATFWVMLSLLWSVRLATDDPKPLRAALWAGVFAGLAAATKYNMALVILPLLLACAVRPTLTASPFPLGRGNACAGVGLLASLLAFFAACPGAILESSTFLKDIRFEAIHVQNRDDPTFRDTGSGFVYHITHNLDAGMGLPLLVLALVSLGYALYRRQRGDALLAAFALPYYILISLAAVRYARYTIPLLPILALWAGRMLAEGSRLPSSLFRRGTVAVGALAALLTCGSAVVLVSVMADEDTRDAALSWLNVNAASPLKIGFPVQPWFGTAPVSPYFSSPGAGAWQAVTPPDIARRIFYSGEDWDVSALETQKPDVVVLSEYDYDDALRVKDPAAQAYVAYLDNNYKYTEGFSSVYSNALIDGMPTRNLPHDMTYPSPGIVIYSRTSKGQLRGND
jgi:hypothetical protein